MKKTLISNYMLYFKENHSVQFTGTPMSMSHILRPILIISYISTDTILQHIYFESAKLKQYIVYLNQIFQHEKKTIHCNSLYSSSILSINMPLQRPHLLWYVVNAESIDCRFDSVSTKSVKDKVSPQKQHRKFSIFDAEINVKSHRIAIVHCQKKSFFMLIMRNMSYEPNKLGLSQRQVVLLYKSNLNRLFIHIQEEMCISFFIAYKSKNKLVS